MQLSVYLLSCVFPHYRHRPKSALERGSARVSSRPGTANVEVIEETDENAPEQDPPQILKVEEMPKPPEVEEPKTEDLKLEVHDYLNTFSLLSDCADFSERHKFWRILFCFCQCRN